MDLTNEHVVHKVFGVGQISTMVNNHVTVEFGADIGEKTFQYPGAFGQYLTLKNPALQNLAHQDYTALQLQQAQAAAQERQQQEERERLRLELLALRKTTAKKPARKKPLAKPVAKTGEN